MNQRCLYFLVVAEELNISKAAKRLFITQQTLSQHIKNLEEEYKTTLLIRKPKLSLTPAGEILVRTLQKMQVLENSLKAQLADGINQTGSVRMGIHSARSSQVIPEILPCFWDRYPNVRFDIYDGVTNSFERNILNGEIDLYLGVNQREDNRLEIVHLLDEKIYVAISKKLLMEYFPYNLSSVIKRLNKEGIELTELLGAPFILNHGISTVNAVFMNFVNSRNLPINVKLTSNSSDVRLRLAAKSQGVCICPSTRLEYVKELNRLSPPFSKLYCFPISGVGMSGELSVVTLKNSYRPAHIDYLIELLKELFLKM